MAAMARKAKKGTEKALSKPVVVPIKPTIKPTAARPLSMSKAAGGTASYETVMNGQEENGK